MNPVNIDVAQQKQLVGVEEHKSLIKAVVPDTKKKTLTPIIVSTVEKGSNVHTDEYPTTIDRYGL